MRGISVLVAGAGLAGLTAARELVKKGATVTIIDARARVGGRVITFRDPLLFGQHAEAGGDLIDESQTEICALIKDVGLRMARILAGGFTSISESGGRKRVAGQHGWAELQKHLRPEARAFCLSEQRWDGGVAAALAPESVADWLDRIRATKRLRDVAVGMRGFFLADPRDLSLLALADQFAEDGVPGGEKMFRIVGGNDRLPARLASPLQSRMHLETTLLRVRHAAAGITATLERRGTRHELRADYLVCAMPATTLRDVVFEPAMPEPQQRAIAVLRYGDATKTALQFERATWRRRGKPGGFGTPLPIGAVWDGSEEQRRTASQPSGRQPGILSLLAGGGASGATRELLANGGPSRIVRELTWLDLAKTKLIAWSSLTWEHERWSRGGYAFFDPQFPPALRTVLAQPLGRVFFAGEHTSLRWQGYMNGAVETGLRASEEVAFHERAKR